MLKCLHKLDVLICISNLHKICCLHKYADLLLINVSISIPPPPSKKTKTNKKNLLTPNIVVNIQVYTVQYAKRNVLVFHSEHTANVMYPKRFQNVTVISYVIFCKLSRVCGHINSLKSSSVLKLVAGINFC